MGMVGAPYRYGGDDPGEGFDCSGLVFYAFTHSGYGVPRTSREQFRAARKIALRDAGAGDVMFFQDQDKLSHVGIYIGDGLFVHAPANGQRVTVASIDSPYYQRAPRRGRSPPTAVTSLEPRRRFARRDRRFAARRITPGAGLLGQARALAVAARARDDVQARASREQRFLGRDQHRLDGCRRLERESEVARDAVLLAENLLRVGRGTRSTRGACAGRRPL